VAMNLFDDHPGPEQTRNQRNEVRISNPQPGDYWHEMFCPYFVVIRVDGDGILVCDKKLDVDADHWSWDLSKCRYMTKDELRKRVTCRSMPDKFVADCSLKSHMWVVDAYAELQHERTYADLYAD
jgi:hypothetical protein